jgi:hypothetical protein
MLHLSFFHHRGPRAVWTIFILRRRELPRSMRLRSEMENSPLSAHRGKKQKNPYVLTGGNSRGNKRLVGG